MNDFLINFLNKYETSQEALNILTGEMKLNYLFMGIFLIPGFLMTIFLTVKWIKKEITITKLEGFSYILIAVFFFTWLEIVSLPDKDKYPSEYKHYAIISKIDIEEQIKQNKNLSDEEKEVILKALNLSKEEMKSINGDDIYDLQPLKEYSVMNKETLINILKLKEKERNKNKDKPFVIEINKQKDFLYSTQHWIINKIYGD